MVEHFSDCGIDCHHKCQKFISNLCGINQKILAATLESVRSGSKSSITSSTAGAPSSQVRLVWLFHHPHSAMLISPPTFSHAYFTTHIQPCLFHHPHSAMLISPPTFGHAYFTTHIQPWLFHHPHSAMLISPPTFSHAYFTTHIQPCLFHHPHSAILISLPTFEQVYFTIHMYRTKRN